MEKTYTNMVAVMEAIRELVLNHAIMAIRLKAGEAADASKRRSQELCKLYGNICADVMVQQIRHEINSEAWLTRYDEIVTALGGAEEKPESAC